MPEDIVRASFIVAPNDDSGLGREELHNIDSNEKAYALINKYKRESGGRFDKEYIGTGRNKAKFHRFLYILINKYKNSLNKRRTR